MKIKKISAIILAGALLVSAVGMNAFAADANPQPTITVFGNEATPTEAGKEYDFSLRLANFSGNVAGMDIELTSDGAEFTGAENTTLKLEKDSNYTISTDGKKIHIVELTDGIKGNETIKLKAKVNKTGTITVTVKGLAKDGTTLLTTDQYTLKGANVAVAPKIQNPTETTVTPNTDKFIPYGFLKDSNGNYIRPDENGKYNNVDTEKSDAYREFDIPTTDANVKTFGYSAETFNEKDAIQFGSYALKLANGKRGTMCITGAWKDYVAHKIKNSNMSVEQIVNYISNKYDAYIKNYDYIELTFNDGTAKSIKIYKVEQTKEMWSNSDYIQYALRIYNIASDLECVAVGYQTSNDNTIFSTEIKATTITEAKQ